MSGNTGNVETDSQLLTEAADGQAAGSYTLAKLRNIIASETAHIASANANSMTATAADGTAARTMASRFSDTINVKDFGAQGDNSTDDTAAINAALTYVRNSIGSGYYMRLFFPPGIYVTTSPLNFTGFASNSDFIGALVVDGWGATIHGKFTTGAIVDMMGSRWVTVNGLTIYGDSTTTPRFGIQMGRIGNGVASDMHKFNNLRVVGWFTTAAVYNFGSETVQWNELYASNLQSGSAYALILDAYNSFSVTSTFATLSASTNTLASMQENTFISATVANSSSTVSPILVRQANSKTRFVSSVAIANNYSVGCTIDMQYNAGFPLCQFDADIHMEPAGTVVNAFMFTGATNQVVSGFRHCEEYALYSGSVFKLNTGVTNLTIGNLDLEIAALQGVTPTVFDAPTQYTVSGNVRVPTAATFNSPATFVGSVQTGAGGGESLALTATAGKFIVSSGGPTITSGSAAPSGTQPSGSVYLRTSGSAGARLYVTSGGGTWAAVAGV